MGKKVMGYWDCSYCGNKKIEGLKRDCPNCGNPRGSDVRFYVDKENIVYLTEEQAAGKGKGADWLCPYCDKLNPVTATSCIGCGAPKEESTNDYFTKDISPSNTSAKEYNSCERESEEYSPQQSEPLQPVRKVSDSSNYRHFINWKLICIILTAFVFVGSLIALFTPKQKNFTLTGFQWERSINIESYETVNESDWYVPTGGRVQYTREEVRDHDTVLDHYETVTKTRRVVVGYHYEYKDNGDGTFDEVKVDDYGNEEYTEQEPVYKEVPIYDTKYYYEIERWIYKRSVNTSGIDHNPVWGEVQLSDNEREGSKNTVYKVLGYYKKGKPKTIKVNDEIWNKMASKREYVVKTNSTGAILEIIE